MNWLEIDGTRAPRFGAREETRGDREIPLSLYVHFPWCVRKCPYCDFNSHPLRGEIPEDEYLQALLRDLDYELFAGSRIPSSESRPLISIFLGGGTPSLFSTRIIDELLEAVARRLDFAPDIEITIEANPGAADAQRFRGYRAAGVNRLSLGAQSFDDARLRRLGRIHGSAEIYAAVDAARAAGFDNLNLDLMYALPAQSVEAALDDLQRAIALAPSHLSWYQLTVEPNTPFAAAPPPLPDDDAAWAMQHAGRALLAEHGYRRYEVSAFARDARYARHNLNYWRFGDYLAIGAGAHAKRSRVVGAGLPLAVERSARRGDPRSYLAAAGTPGAVLWRRGVPSAELPFEYAMNALRLVEGFSLSAFTRTTGLPASCLQPTLQDAVARGLLVCQGEWVRASDRGLDLLNELLQWFLPDAAPATA